jgi:hypothetical protein
MPCSAEYRKFCKVIPPQPCACLENFTKSEEFEVTGFLVKISQVTKIQSEFLWEIK